MRTKQKLPQPAAVAKAGRLLTDSTEEAIRVLRAAYRVEVEALAREFSADHPHVDEDARADHGRSPCRERRDAYMDAVVHFADHHPSIATPKAAIPDVNYISPSTTTTLPHHVARGSWHPRRRERASPEG